MKQLIAAAQPKAIACTSGKLQAGEGSSACEGDVGEPSDSPDLTPSEDETNSATAIPPVAKPASRPPVAKSAGPSPLPQHPLQQQQRPAGAAAAATQLSAHGTPPQHLHALLHAQLAQQQQLRLSALVVNLRGMAPEAQRQAVASMPPLIATHVAQHLAMQALPLMPQPWQQIAAVMSATPALRPLMITSMVASPIMTGTQKLELVQQVIAQGQLQG
jgi:hypothetical protein